MNNNIQNQLNNSKLTLTKLQKRFLEEKSNTDYGIEANKASVKFQQDLCNLENFINEPFDWGQFGGKEFLKTYNISIIDMLAYQINHKTANYFLGKLKEGAAKEIINIIEKSNIPTKENPIKIEESPINYKEEHYFPNKKFLHKGILTIGFGGLSSTPSFFESFSDSRNIYNCYNKKFQQLFADEIDFNIYNQQYWKEVSSLIDDKKYNIFDFFATSMGTIKLSNFLEFLHKKLDNEDTPSDEKNKISNLLNNVRDIHLVNPAQSLESKDLRFSLFKIGAFLRKSIFFDIPNIFNKIFGQELRQDVANIDFIKNNLLVANNESSNNLQMSKLQNIVLSQCPTDKVIEPINIGKRNNLSYKITVKETKHHNDGFGYLKEDIAESNIFDFLSNYINNIEFSAGVLNSPKKQKILNNKNKSDTNKDIRGDVSNQSTDTELTDEFDNQDINEDPKFSHVNISNYKSLNVVDGKGKNINK